MKAKPDGFIRLILVLPFLTHAEQLGHETRPVLKAMGLDDEMLRDPAATVHAEILYGLCNSLAELTSDPFLGCHVAERFDLAGWPPFAEAGRISRTVGEFLNNFLMRVPREANSVTHALTIEADRSTYSVSRMVYTRNKPVQVEGFGAGMLLQLLLLATGSLWSPQHVRVDTPHPEAVGDGYLGVRVMKSDGPGLAVSFPTEWLHSPLFLDVPRHSATKKPSEPDLSIVAALRSAALPLLENRDVGKEELSAALGIDPHRLVAALKMHNTTVARELKRLRIDQAKVALQQGKQSIAEIGRTLGYSDQSHFSRFFRSQTGVSPGEFRASF